jgi:LPS-assembly lipoprotein
MRIKLIRNSIVFTLVLFLTACGYHMRGAIDIPEQLKSVYLQGASGNLHSEMKSALRLAGGQLVSLAEQAGLVIKILRDEMRRREASIDESGYANEFELNYSLVFKLSDAEGKVLIEQREVEITRYYFNDQIDVLAKNNEEIVIRNEIYRQAVKTIFAQARAVLKKKY